jgi:hypothetical protein
MSVMVFVGAFGTAPRDAAPAAADAATLDPAMYPTPRVTAPLDDEQYIRWLRLDRFVPLQDWLDPTVVKIGPARAAARLDPPAPTTGRGPF